MLHLVIYHFSYCGHVSMTILQDLNVTMVLRSRVRTNKNENIELSFHTFLRIYFIKLQIKLT